MRTSVRIGAGLLFALIVCRSLPAATQPSGTGSAGGAAAGSSSNPAKEAAELKKLEAEREKLDQEIADLKVSNEALGRWAKWATAWGGLVGSFIGSIVTAFVVLIGWGLNKTQRDKLALETAQAREKHLIEVFQNLGEKEPRIRIGAVAVLVQRIGKIRSTKPQTGFRRKSVSSDHQELSELPTLVSVLIAMTKHEQEVPIQKYVADGLAQSLDAIVPDGGQLKPESPLLPYDFQGAKLENAWWRMIDARGVDFYGAHLVRAGMRKAFLSKSVLKKANLLGATLAEAQLEEADLQESNLTNAKMAKAKLRKAKLGKAILKRADLTRADLTEADLSGADLSGAKLAGAIITGAVFTGANLSGADFGGAPPPSTT